MNDVIRGAHTPKPPLKFAPTMTNIRGLQISKTIPINFLVLRYTVTMRKI